MSSESPRAATAAVDAARGAIARLDPSRHPEDLAADLLDAWEAVEAAVRALVGGSPATGTELLRGARQRQLFTFDQANALAAFHAVREHTRETDYRPSPADVETARRALAALEGAAHDVAKPNSAAEVPTVRLDSSPAQPVASISPPGMRGSLPDPSQWAPMPRESRSRGRIWIVLLVLVLAGTAAGGAYYWFGGPRRDAVVSRAISEYEAGNRDAAAADFRQALLIDPDYAIAHVYLARIARNAGNMAAANEELQLALTADPENALALREMGAYLFTAGSYELARKFYVRAVSANPEDATAKGFLGCTLVKLGRIDEGERWITRAGPGVWTTCVAGATPSDSSSR